MWHDKKSPSIEIESDGVPIKAWIEGVPVEEAAKEQLRSVARLPVVWPHVAVMPDVHFGIGLVARDIDLERDRAQLKAIRRGEWSLEQLEQWAQDKEKALEVLYHTSVVPHEPDEPLIKRHLLHCLEMHYGDLSAAVVQPDEALATLRKVADLTKRYR